MAWRLSCTYLSKEGRCTCARFYMRGNGVSIAVPPALHRQSAHEHSQQDLKNQNWDVVKLLIAALCDVGRKCNLFYCLMQWP